MIIILMNAVVFAFICLFCVCFIVLQNRFMYPTGASFYNGMQPSYKNLAYENITIQTEDNIDLKGWFMYPNDTKDDESIATFILMHESMGELQERILVYETLIKQLRVNVLAMPYRGYSGNKGDPTEATLKVDAEAILKYVNNTKS